MKYKCVCGERIKSLSERMGAEGGASVARCEYRCLGVSVRAAAQAKPKITVKGVLYGA